MRLLARSQEWRVGLVREDRDVVLQGGDQCVEWFRPANPSRYFWADPFPLVLDNELYVLCEEFDYWKHEGRIVGFRVPDPGEAVEPAVAIERPYHLSYPYVFSTPDGVFCMPESAAAGRVDLYRMGRHPFDWSLEATILSEFPVLDPTLAEWQNRWWLFGTCAEKGREFDLHIWSADRILGPWHPHGRNPVKRDPGSSRPAGPLFMRHGRLVRPAQDCSTTYGARVVLNEVVELDRDRYQERATGIIEPARFASGLAGLHTISGADGYVLIDGLHNRMKLLDIASRARRGAAKLLKSTVVTS